MTSEKKTASRTIGTVAAALAVIAVTGVTAAVVNADSLKTTTALTPVRTVTAATMPQSFADVIEKVTPAVVSVQVAGGPAARQTASPDRMPEPFRRFFDDDTRRRFFGEDGRRSERQRPRQRRGASLGSGFVIDADGHIVTNAHVVRGGGDITVTLKNGETLKAKLVGTDRKTDLALLKVASKKTLPFVAWGESDRARVGDWVVAIGNPFGLGHSATTGIISARGREIGQGPYDDFLQIDAPINRGNSGGPAFDRHGKVVGINTAIFSPTGGSVGIGFAIPAEIARKVIAELKQNGSVERGWLGVSIQPLTKDLAGSLNLDTTEGALVAQVMKDSPAEAAKLRQGDVILSVGGNKVQRFRDVARIVAGLAPDKTASFEVWRDGKKITVDAKIGRLPADKKVAAAGPDSEPSAVLGMRLAALDAETRRAYRIGRGVAGVVITEVARDSAAARKGLRRGDVILGIDRRGVTDPADVTSRIDQAKTGDRQAVLLLVRTRAGDRFVALPLRDA